MHAAIGSARPFRSNSKTTFAFVRVFEIDKNSDDNQSHSSKHALSIMCQLLSVMCQLLSVMLQIAAGGADVSSSSEQGTGYNDDAVAI